MAQWKETLEPYIRVHEKIKTAAINPVAGEDLIIGCAFISDAGPSNPTLIRGQKEFLETYSSQDLTEEYIKSLDSLYGEGQDTIASTMWLNAYRLAGSGNILAVRAFKGDNLFFAKPIEKSDDINTSKYILKDGAILKQVPDFKIVINRNGDLATETTDGWLISLNSVGNVGNLITDEGAQYDQYVHNLKELVDLLNETPKFFSPVYKFYKDVSCETETEYDKETKLFTNGDPICVKFEEVYLGSHILDTAPNVENSDVNAEMTDTGLYHCVVCQINPQNPSQQTIDLNDTAYSGFDEVNSYAINKYNSNVDLKVRIRRFNHDAVVSRDISGIGNDANAKGKSPYTVLPNVISKFYDVTDEKKKEVIEARDFYEFAILDPSVSGGVEYYNVGKIFGRGDMTLSELNELLNMIGIVLPDNLSELGLGYYSDTASTSANTFVWELMSEEEVDELDTTGITTQTEDWVKNVAPTGLNEHVCVSNAGKFVKAKGVWRKTTPSNDMFPSDLTSSQNPDDKSTWTGYSVGDIVRIPIVGSEEYNCFLLREIKFESYNSQVGDQISYHTSNPGVIDDIQTGAIVQIQEENESYYKSVEKSFGTLDEIVLNVRVPAESELLKVSDSDLLKAIDKIDEDEIYQTEGLTDLGNTNGLFQTYLANMAANSNYFYAVSTVDSTNYLAIANSVKRLSKDHYKLYCSAPWDIDTGTVGFEFHASPSVLYWEAVNRNRGLDREFMAMFGQRAIMQYQRPVVEFLKRPRQLLLSKRVNSVMWDTQIQAWTMNDSYTKESENNILNEDGNSRLAIRISKSVPKLLRQFIGRQINDILYTDMYRVLQYWLDTTIMPLSYSIEAYNITIDSVNTDEDRRANRVKILIEVRFYRSLKYVEVYNNYFDVGMSFTGTI